MISALHGARLPRIGWPPRRRGRDRAYRGEAACHARLEAGSAEAFEEDGEDERVGAERQRLLLTSGFGLRPGSWRAATQDADLT
jgi:hypothetical protein